MPKLRTHAKGDCYRANGKLFLDLCNQHPELKEELRLCHGWVTAPNGSDKSRTFHHAWVEVQEDLVFDHCNGGKITMRKVNYFKLGKIDDSLVVRYRHEEVLVRILKTSGWSLGTI